MWKPLVVLAIVASTTLIKSSEGSETAPYGGENDKPCHHHKCSKPNEVFDSCPNPCPPRECGIDKALILCAPAPKPGSSDCKPGCRCSDGFLRNKSGICIPEDQCPYDCPRNETYDRCLSSCPPRYCGVIIAAVSCPVINECDCEPGCRCSDGFLRNGEGFCVLEDDCPKCTRSNEQYDVCPAPCPPRRCDVDESAIRCAAPPSPGDPECRPGCRCADGFVRNADGECITRDQCPKCTKPHEILDPCPSKCPPQTCEAIGRKYRCPKKGKCKEACVCEPGYMRNKIGECISRKNCLKCRGPHEYFSCGGACDNVCATLPYQNKTNCPIFTFACNPMCYCEDGYARNDNDICIPIDQCEPTLCGENEIFSECPSSQCRPLKCTEVGFPVPCPISLECPEEPGCICDYGYARDSEGKCIPVELCSSCGGDHNAVSGCGVNCGRHCSDRNSKHPVSCIEVCYENACDCRDGFLYDDNTGKCVPPDQCTPTCESDEVYSECIEGDCAPKYCSDLGYPIPCPRIDPRYCTKGCICKEGYVRADNGTCIPKGQCPSCGGDPNALSGCGVNCGRLCSNWDQGPVACPEICNINGCDCRPEYVLDESTGKCIPPEQCVSCGGDFNAQPGCDEDCSQRCPGPKPTVCKCYDGGCECKDGFVYDPTERACVRPEECSPPCGANEVLSNCSNGGCGPWTCSDLGFPTGCVKMDQKYCTVGCVCQEGFVRENEICIPVSECPSCGGDPNARAGCGINCGRLCSNYNKGPVSCIAACFPNACDCKKEYVLDENIGKCVLPEDCTPICGENEKFSECVNGGCEAKNCSQIGEPVPCVRPLKCEPGCLCADGFLRAADGTCVPKDQCPLKCTGANEVYDPCPPTCPPENCDSIGKRYHCPLKPANISSADCHGACRCKPNFLRNKIGECIAAEDCLKCTGPHEYFSCGVACDNVCATLHEQSQDNCPIINIQCNSMCYCEKGFARDANNICIPIENCPDVRCGINERWEPCPARLCVPQSCKELGFPIDCPALPEDENEPCPGPPGCVCEFNYVRDENGICIPQKQCPSCGGDMNAESGCGLNCGRLCSNYDKGPVPCPRICYPNSCDCKQGYVFDENKEMCVLPKDCSPVCGDNEEFSDCINGECTARNCSQLGQPIICPEPDPECCIEGCVCVDGYLRARNGTCVPEEKCDNCIRPHEHFDACARFCPPETCESIGRTYKCPAAPAVCRGACRCDDGYFRNKIGECITKKECLKCKGPNEYFSCGGACDNVCETLHEQNKTNCPIINIKCNPMCYCEDGYARDEKNICIPIEECPVIPICGINERLEKHPSSLCQPEKCTDLGFPIDCDDLPAHVCSEPPACVCIDEHVRDDNGICIPNKLCPSCGGDPNAVYGCGLKCGNTCSDYNQTDIVCPAVCYTNACDCRKGFVYDRNLRKCVRPKHCTPTCKENEVYDTCANGGCGKRNCSQLGQPDLCIDVITCIGGCVCAEGYLRAKNGTCVPEKQCPIPDCGANERFEWCPAALCEPQTCSELGFPIMCPALSGDGSDCPGQSECICDYGYVRNDNGICIPKKECPSCGGDENAESGCGINCGRLCSNYNKGPVPCPKICKFNACDCKKGYVFDVNIKKCVRPKHCTPTCGMNEVFSECINGGCQAKNCSQLGKPVPCVKLNPDDCIKGCLCIEGYLRASNGDCIPKEQCNRKCWRAHEVFDPCPPTCPPKTCESIGHQYNCPAIIVDQDNCEGACRCEDGYYRNKIGECISKEDCLKCTGPNEYFSCGGACDNVCATLKYQNQTNCPIVNIQCNSMCYCTEGHARDDKNICVPIEHCPEPKCGENEVFEYCPDWLCRPKTCSEVGFPIVCAALLDDYSNTCPGPPGCVCIDDLVKNDCGKCIPRKECPSCGGDINAVSGCGTNCGRLCSNYNETGVVCPLICNINGCDCRKGFVFDTNTDQCVLPKDCTPVCRKNEVYDLCANGGCNRRKCSELAGPIICKDPIECIADCVCVDGFLRNEDGVCVPESECKVVCSRPHEVFHSCPSTCPPRTCGSLDRVYICPIEWGQEPLCEPGCVCEDGYYYNKIGECTSKQDCLKCMGPNEYFSCGGACDNVCATLHEKSKDNCPIVNIKCNPMCYCEDGYARNASNICIPIEDCPPPVCRKNEVYDLCANGGCNRRKCSELAGPIICKDPIECIADCVCVDGFLRNEDGVCVPESECKVKCMGPNEYFSCGGACDNVCATLHEQSKNNCPIVNIKCNPMCYCEDGYARNASNICIPIEDCPPPVCRKNEVYDLCANGGCNRRKCSELAGPIICKDPIECIADCVCVDGFLRNEDGVCVPESECKVVCPRPHEVFNSCPSTCPPRTCESLDRVYICPIEWGQEPPCKPGCVCEDGYYYNKIGECTSEQDCLKCMGPNEYFSCGGACDNVCATLHEQSKDNCPIVNIKCNPMCYCEDGYARNASNICIPIEDCPPPVCGRNEIYDKCANGGCNRRKCSELDGPIVCKNPVECIGDCVCVKGYLRDENGVCIPESKCILNCTKPHEVFDPCPMSCYPGTCESLDRVYICPIEMGVEEPCVPSCVCESGYFKNKIGECITQDECLKCTGPNEYYSCGGACDNVCATLNEQSQDDCPIINIDCNRMCYCERGYARNASNICIPIEDCPPSRCGPNEIYEENPSTVCEPQHCSELGYPLDCPSEDTDCKEKPACICKFGYVRDEHGVCIAKTQCPSCGGDKNAVSGCGNKCGRQCSDYGTNVTCLPMCYINGCDCREGLVFDEVTNKCVRYEDCSK